MPMAGWTRIKRCLGWETARLVSADRADAQRAADQEKGAVLHPVAGAARMARSGPRTKASPSPRRVLRLSKRRSENLRLSGAGLSLRGSSRPAATATSRRTPSTPARPRESQAHLETRILRLRQRWRNAVVVDVAESPGATLAASGVPPR